MKIIPILLVCLASLALKAQNPVYKHWGIKQDTTALLPNSSSSYLSVDDRLFFIAKNNVYFIDLPDANLHTLITIGTEEDTHIDDMIRDAMGHFYLVGNTQLNESFTTPGVYKEDFENYPNDDFMSNSFIAKYNSEGVLLWRTYIEPYFYGGQVKRNITLDHSGNIYYVSDRHYEDIISDAPFQSAVTIAEARADSQEDTNIITKLNTSGQLLWQTFFAHHQSFITSLSTTQNRLMVTGVLMKNINYTLSNPTFFSTEGALIQDPMISSTGAGLRGFVNAFHFDGTRDWGTYLNNQSTFFFTDAKATSEDLYIMHQSNSLPLLDNAYLTGNRHFLTKFSESGMHQWTFRTVARNFVLDAKRDIYLFGATEETSGFTTTDAYQATKNTYVPAMNQLPNQDAFHHIVNNAATDLRYGTYYGYEGSDHAVMMWPTSDGYISLERTTQNIVPNAFITQGEDLDYTLPVYGYHGYVLSKFSNQPLSVSNQEMSTIKVFPNPFENTIHLENEIPFKTTDELLIYNELGQHIFSKRNIGAESSLSIDTSSWSSGFYFLKVIISGRTTHYKIVKH